MNKPPPASPRLQFRGFILREELTEKIANQVYDWDLDTMTEYCIDKVREECDGKSLDELEEQARSYGAIEDVTDEQE